MHKLERMPSVLLWCFTTESTVAKSCNGRSGLTSVWVYHEEQGGWRVLIASGLCSRAPSCPAAQASAKESCASLCLGKQVSHTETGLSSQDGLDSRISGHFQFGHKSDGSFQFLLRGHFFEWSFSIRKQSSRSTRGRSSRSRKDQPLFHGVSPSCFFRLFMVEKSSFKRSLNLSVPCRASTIRKSKSETNPIL